MIGRRGPRMMNLQQELDALIESTMAFANDVIRRQRIPHLPIALRAAEQALADTSKQVTHSITITPASVRDEIRQRVNNFRAHKDKMAWVREDEYLQVQAMRAHPVATLSHP